MQEQSDSYANSIVYLENNSTSLATQLSHDYSNSAFLETESNCMRLKSESNLASNSIFNDSKRLIHFCKDLWKKGKVLDNNSEDSQCKTSEIKLFLKAKLIWEKGFSYAYHHLKGILYTSLCRFKDFLTSDFLVKYLTVSAFAAYVMTFIIIFGSGRVSRNVFVKNSHHRTLFAFALALISYLIVPSQDMPVTYLKGLRFDLKILMYNLLFNYLVQASLSCF